MLDLAYSSHRYLFIIGLSVLTSGCKVGPNFHTPQGPATSQYIQNKSVKKTVSDPASKAAGKAQYFQLGRDIPSEWWHVFHSKGMNALIQAGIEHNPNLQAARAALVEANENYKVQVGGLFPMITGNFAAQRERFSSSSFGGSTTSTSSAITFNLFNANVAATYALDVFGGVRRQIEAAGAQVDFQQFELEAAFLTLSSNIVTTSINIASLQAQIKATYQLIKAQRDTLTVLKGQFNLGGSSRTQVLLQETQLSTTIATLPPLKQSLAQQYHLLSILVGELPREDKLPILKFESLNLPQDLPLSCPSLLTRQRPDIRAAEALLHAASAQIGVATANIFPQVSLNGNYGGQSNVLDMLFASPNRVWGIGAGVAQTLFKGGSLLAQRRAAIAAFEQAAAQYKQTVLTAFQNVADVLRALQHDAELLKARKEVEVTSLATLKLTQQQFQLGGSSFLELLIAQRAYQESLISRIQAQTARFTDTAALYQALGGGWWNPIKVPVTQKTCTKELALCVEK